MKKHPAMLKPQQLFLFFKQLQQMIISFIYKKEPVLYVFESFGLSFRISSFTMHGKWSEMLLIMIAEEIFVWSKCGNLQNIWPAWS